MGNILKYVIEVGLAAVFAAIFIPMGLQYIAEANMTGVNAMIANLFTVALPLGIIAGVVIKFMPDEVKERAGI